MSTIQTLIDRAEALLATGGRRNIEEAERVIAQAHALRLATKSTGLHAEFTRLMSSPTPRRSSASAGRRAPVEAGPITMPARVPLDFVKSVRDLAYGGRLVLARKGGRLTADGSPATVTPLPGRLDQVEIKAHGRRFLVAAEEVA